MPIRTALVLHEYAQRQIKVGEAFEVEPQHVALWLTLGRIEPLEGEPGYSARDLSADAPATYMTRDLQAQEPRRRGRPRKAGTQ